MKIMELHPLNRERCFIMVVAWLQAGFMLGRATWPSISWALVTLVIITPRTLRAIKGLNTGTNT